MDRNDRDQVFILQARKQPRPREAVPGTGARDGTSALAVRVCMASKKRGKLFQLLPELYALLFPLAVTGLVVCFL